MQTFGEGSKFPSHIQTDIQYISVSSIYNTMAVSAVGLVTSLLKTAKEEVVIISLLLYLIMLLWLTVCPSTSLYCFCYDP